MHRILVIGEAWGEKEEEEGKPFVGPSGRLLRALFHEVGINYYECYVTNVFNLRPKPKNDVINLCGDKASGIPNMPPLQKSKYVLAKYQEELVRLYKEITDVNPTLIILLGATAAWATLKTTGIKNIRGAPIMAHIGGRDFKCFPTYHPAAVMREWALRPIILSDLDKCTREAQYREIRRPQRFVWVEPTLEDLYRFEQEYILPSPDLSIDVETKGPFLDCVGFAPRKDISLVVPFIKNKVDHYWPTVREELLAWIYVQRICALPKRIVGQNGLFDIHRLWRERGIAIPAYTDDTMLLHHALQPEMEKGLGFLGSIYTDEASWKFMRKNTETLKRED